MARVVHPIEKQSYEILRARADTSALPPWTRAVVERVIHASADLGYLDDLVCAEADLAAGVQALLDGAPVVADSAMTAAGITAREAICRIDDRRAAALTRVLGITRAAAGIRVAGGEVGPGAGHRPAGGFRRRRRSQAGAARQRPAGGDQPEREGRRRGRRGRAQRPALRRPAR